MEMRVLCCCRVAAVAGTQITDYSLQQGRVAAQRQDTAAALCVLLLHRDLDFNLAPDLPRLGLGHLT